MKVRMKINISGTRDGQDWPSIGECIVVPDAEGADLCAAGYAEPVADIKPEKATAPATELRGEQGPEIVALPKGTRTPRKAAEKRG